MRIHFSILVLFSLLGNVLFSQEKIIENRQVKFEHIKNSDGLVHNSVGVSFQDSRGYLWFGTYNGLYKYNGYEFQLYTHDSRDKKSLISNRVTEIFEDSSNQLWIGTNLGLSKYDRNTDSFQNSFFNSANQQQFSLKDEVHTIVEDKSGFIWIGTVNGLYHFSKEAEKGYNIGLCSDSTSEESKMITAVVQDKNNKIWVGTNKGLYFLQFDATGSVTYQPYKQPAISSSATTALLVDNSNTLWVGTKKALYRHRQKEDGSIEVQSLLSVQKYFENGVTSLLQDHQGTLWIGTNKQGAFAIDLEQWTYKHYTQKTSDEYSFRSNHITHIYEDTSGVLWFGSQRGGVSKLDLNKKRIDHFKHSRQDDKSLSGNVVNSIFIDTKQQTWIATYGNGLSRLSGQHPEKGFIHYDKNKRAGYRIGSDILIGITEDNYGHLWVGSMSDGISQISKTSNDKLRTQQFTKNSTQGNLKHDKITDLFKDHQGDIWMGGGYDSGLMKFTPEKNFGKLPKITQYTSLLADSISLSSYNVSSIYEDHQHTLWIGTNNEGLVKVVRDANNEPTEFISITGSKENENLFKDNPIFAIHATKNNDLWIGTFGGGLYKIPANQTDNIRPEVSIFKKEDGLPNNEIYAILEDKSENLWLSTNNGISKFNSPTQSFNNLTLDDGLQALNFRRKACFLDASGTMYFGGINGYNSFNPDTFKKNNSVPNTQITGFKIFNKDVKTGEELLGSVVLEKEISETNHIVLKNSHNSFTFEFSGLHFAAPKQNKYKYKLEGFDKEWLVTNATRRFATYANLDAGNYVFNVMSANNDGIWNTTAKQIHIKVLPPLWKTWWAYSLYILFMIFLMWLFRRNILIKEGYKNRLEIEKIEQEKIKEVNKMKLEFFTNISHEFKTPLTLIIGPLQNLLKMKSTNEKTKEALLLMQRNANHLFRLINQVMEFRKIQFKELEVTTSNGDLVKFCNEIVLSFKVLAERKNIALSFEASTKELIASFDWDKMEKIVNNLISNSIKYTPEHKTIVVSLSIPKNNKLDSSKEIKLIVKDTGNGISEEKLPMIFDRFYQIDTSKHSSDSGSSGVGLALVKALVELLNGSIKVKSEVGKGTTFSLRFPLQLTNSEIIDNKTPQPDSISEDMSIEATFSGSLSDDEEKAPIERLPLLLIVEDNPDMQLFIKDSLEDRYEILQAFNGKEGLKIASKQVPSIIISDVMMPKMDGIEMVTEIKKNPITNHIPIILLTAKTSIEHRI